MVQVVNSSTVKLGPNLSITSYLDGGKLVADTWVRGYVDLSEFPAISYDGMYFADVSGTSQPVMYLDDIVAVPKNISGTSGTTGTTGTVTSGTSTTSGSTSGTTGSTTTAKVTTGTTSGTSGSSTTTTSGTSTSEVTSGTTTDVATTGEITTTTTGNTTDVDSTTTTSELVSSANIVACHSVILVLIFAVLIQL